ncbi:hypothetical protein PR048_019712 [Dryococelus australis]|uniref:Uncharacterized protein n=1 Tax=Dryococelus australis TaxID=614101 RepID=A0ABQ9H483_9NEOP|nr:hypothetical protein PR048_019712 [Dryococelus australis]
MQLLCKWCTSSLDQSLDVAIHFLVAFPFTESWVWASCTRKTFSDWMPDNSRRVAYLEELRVMWLQASSSRPGQRQRLRTPAYATRSTLVRPGVTDAATPGASTDLPGTRCRRGVA